MYIWLRKYMAKKLSTDEVADCEHTQLSFSVLPVPRVDRAIRKRYGGKRVSAGTAVYTTAVLENVLLEVIMSSKKEAIASKKKRISIQNLIAAVRTHPSLCRLFRSYVFSSGAKLSYKSMDLLTKYDREAVLKSRENRKAKKEQAIASKAVPGVDEE